MRDLNGDYFNMGASFCDGNNCHFLKYPGSLDMNNYQVMGTIESCFPNHIGYIHTYGMTDNYFVFCEQPCRFYARIHGRRTQLLLHHVQKNRKIINFVNCNEYENHAVIDAMDFNASDFYSFMSHKSSISSQFFPKDLNLSSTWRQENNIVMLRPQYPFSESECMYRCINTNFNCREYQYSYAQCGNSIIKFDSENGRTLTWRGENEFRTPFRSMFVPNPSGMCEDDGVLVSCCYQSRDNFPKNYMVFINAHNMEEISRLDCDSPLSFGSSDSFYSPHFMQW
ncbi:unnamed protein product [Lepeophtheirus salmonis]|uniref:(salmon louse) hypothetical protein n=1 Tax=Lepeophtheirus salmonis TaxID=72036 RepID=A0A7R8CFM0_LEPSM|nr:unnamed protein product [Lepeophtheirus salmonis]CAF2807746.1 unnamed protein product [Lepeophtheirus salmonis]